MKRSQSYFSLQEACKPKTSLSSIPCTRSWPRLTPSLLQIKNGPGMTAKERQERDADMDSDCGSSISSCSGSASTVNSGYVYEEDDHDHAMAGFYEDEIDEADRHGRAKKQYICSLLEEKRQTNAVVNAARKLVHARAIAEADLPSTHRILVRARVVVKPDPVNTQRPPLQHLGWAPGTSVPSVRSNASRARRMIRIVQFAAEQGMTQSLDRLLILSDASPVPR